MMTAFTRLPYIQARYYGGALNSPGTPQQIVIHSLECDLKRVAVSLAEGYFQNDQTSAHTLTDPWDQCTCVPEGQKAWHCGNGNNTSKGKEHAGRATWSAAEWRTPLALQMLRLSAKDVAKDCVQYDIPVRWLSVVQVANNERGLCTHNDMRLARGGTTHWDPGPNFPFAEYLAMVGEEVNALVGGTPKPTKPNSPEEDDDMALTEKDRQAIAAEAAREFTTELWEQYRKDLDAGMAKVDAIGHSIEVLHTRVIHAQNVDGTPAGK